MRTLALRHSAPGHRPDLRLLRRIVRHLLQSELQLPAWDLGVYLVGDEEIQRLNERYLQHAGPTDVLAFDYGPPPRGALLLAPSHPACSHRQPPSGAASPRAPRDVVSGATPPGAVRRPARELRSGPCPVASRVSERDTQIGSAEGAQTVHGEVFIGLDVALRQSRRFRTTPAREVVRYAVHGILHLLGHDDHHAAARRRMKSEEDRLVRRLGRQFPVDCVLRRPRRGRPT